MIRFSCPKCDKKFNAKDQLAGKRIKCSRCSEIVKVPGGSDRPAVKKKRSSDSERPKVKKKKASSKRAVPVAKPRSSKTREIEEKPRISKKPLGTKDKRLQKAKDKLEAKMGKKKPGSASKKTAGGKMSKYERMKEKMRSGELDPTAPDAEMPKLDIFLLAGALLLGFLLPMVLVHPFTGETKTIFINFEILGADGAPFIIKFHFLYPLLAGLGLIFVALKARGTFRGVILIAVGVLPILITLISKDAGRSMKEMFSAMSQSSEWVPVVLAGIGLYGLLVTGRSAMFVPRSAAIPVFSGIGGAVVISMLIPVKSRLFGVGDTIGLIEPFVILGKARGGAATGYALLQILAMLTMIAAAVIGFLMIWKKAKRRRMGLIVLILIGASLAFGFIAAMVLESSKSRGMGGMGGTSFLVVVKFLLWLMGLMLLIPVGTIDLVINGSRQPSAD